MIRTSDADLLGAIPSHIALAGLLKATAAEERGERILYFEASNEGLDHQNEVVLAKALSDSADYYLRHGNLDISHYTVLGPRSGLANFMEFEIGRPVEVRAGGGSTFVKAQLYRGDSPMAKNADLVWSSMTRQNPPQRWYPSVGGAVLSKSIRIDPDTKAKVAVVDKVRWSNVALDRCPVNRTVGEVSTMPVGVFTKSMGGFVLGKALEAGYGTDSAALTGGGALRKQSLHGAPPQSYDEFRERLATAIRAGDVSMKSDPEALAKHAARVLRVQPGVARRMVDLFLNDVRAGLADR